MINDEVVKQEADGSSSEHAERAGRETKKAAQDNAFDIMTESLRELDILVVDRTSERCSNSTADQRGQDCSQKVVCNASDDCAIESANACAVQGTDSSTVQRAYAGAADSSDSGSAQQTGDIAGYAFRTAPLTAPRIPPLSAPMAFPARFPRTPPLNPPIRHR